jgi:hypothetical protein
LRAKVTVAVVLQRLQIRWLAHKEEGWRKDGRMEKERKKGGGETAMKI